jgi:threonine synthase
MGHRMLAVLRDSGGGAVAVSEGEIRASYESLASRGIFVGLESGATLAALRLLVAEGSVAPGERALLLFTSSNAAVLAQNALGKPSTRSAM